MWHLVLCGMSNIPGFDRMCEIVNESIHKYVIVYGAGMNYKLHKSIRPSQYRVVTLPREGEHDIQLEKMFGVYLHDSDNSNAYDRDDDNRYIQSLFRGPCGRFIVYASRYNFDVQNMSFSICTYTDTQQTEVVVSATHLEDGPRKQHVYVLLVPLRICAACDKPLAKSYKCSRCREAGIHARYCSKQCQVAHWPVHRAVCGGVVRHIAE